MGNDSLLAGIGLRRGILGVLLGGALRGSLRISPGRNVAALLHRLGDDAAHQRVRADRVVVAGDRELDHVRVDVGIDNGNDRDLELVGLGDGDVFLLGVEDEDGIRTLLHTTDTAEVLLQLLEFAAEQERLLLGHRIELAGQLHPLVFLHLADALGNGLEVGEHATKPTLVDIRHAALLGVAAHRILCLLLRADEQDGAALGRKFPNEVVGDLRALQRLLEIDDVDTVSLAEDEALHLGIPTAGLVPEMNSGFQHLARRDDSHGEPLLSCG